MQRWAEKHDRNESQPKKRQTPASVMAIGRHCHLWIPFALVRSGQANQLGLGSAGTDSPCHLACHLRPRFVRILRTLLQLGYERKQ